MTWSTVKFNEKIDYSDFLCEEDQLNDYLHQKAKEEHLSDLCTLYFLIDPKSVVGGYYVLSSGSIRRQELPTAKARKNLPGYPLGAVHIGRLARHKNLKGMQIGEKLLFSAIGVAVESSEITASFAITVDAKNEKVEKFYKDFGFKDLIRGETDSYPKPLYLKMSDARYILTGAVK